MTIAADHSRTIDQNGYSIVSNVFDDDQVASLLSQIEKGLERGTDGDIKSSRGETNAARNLAELNPDLLDSWTQPQLTELLSEVLGSEFGLVRILYFDKHPNRTWSLPWHKDMTIAVKDNSLPSTQFTKPTRKSGVDHVEAPDDVLHNMLTLRIHLDDVTDDNGPLEVAIGSHAQCKQATEHDHQVARILVQAGDVLAMRPLISHASGSSSPGTTAHRRILHLEFSGRTELQDGFQWQLFHSPAKL